MVRIPAFLKWAGGKRNLIQQIKPFLPEKVDRYFEPFLGGGSMFFYIKQIYSPKYCLISDINADLIQTYIHVRDKPKELIELFKVFSKKNCKEFYYECRKKFNDQDFKGVERSSSFIYLNKTCFNGLYRVNMKGEFNVPFSGRRKPCFSEEDIMFASNLLRNVNIKCQDYRKIKNYVKKNDLVYLDPCYDPLTRTSFVHYTVNRFSLEDREKLANFMNFLKYKEANVRLSNNELEDIRTLYSDMGFRIENLMSPRCINSIGSRRGRITELLIMN